MRSGVRACGVHADAKKNGTGRNGEPIGVRNARLRVGAVAACGLFLSGGGADASALHESPVAEFSVDAGCADQWRLERIGNSDLNRLRTLRETETCPVVRLVQREGPVSAGRAALLRESVPCGKCPGALRSAFTFPFRDSFAGPSVADFYVFRLCRLII